MNTAPHSFGKSLFELLSSMRFAISLLSILAVASIVGTVLKQAEPYNNYIIQFGPFWFQVFEKLGLYDVYHAAWFLLILTFLVASTSVCIARNAPNFVREMRSFREHVSEQSLNAFKHRHEGPRNSRPPRSPPAHSVISKARDTKSKPAARRRRAACRQSRQLRTASAICWRIRPS